MLQLVKKWQVLFKFNGDNQTTIFVHENHIENVLRQISNISFPAETIGIDIKEVRVAINPGGSLTGLGQSGGQTYKPDFLQDQ